MTEKTEWLRGLVAPAMVLALVGQGITGVVYVRDVSHVANAALADASKLEAKVGALEAANGASGARLAVMESQLASALKVLERIDARMEANRGG